MCEGFQSEAPEEQELVSSVGEDVESTAAGFSSLAHATRAPDDPFSNIQDPKIYLVVSLHQASKKMPGKYLQLVSSSPANAAVHNYFQHQKEVPPPYIS